MVIDGSNQVLVRYNGNLSTAIVLKAIRLDYAVQRLTSNLMAVLPVITCFPPIKHHLLPYMCRHHS